MRTSKALVPAFFVTCTVLIVALLGFGVYSYRCRIITCEPASWATLYQIAQAEAKRADSEYFVGNFYANPSRGTTFTSEGPLDIDIRIDLISTQISPENNGIYPIYSIDLNDRQLSIFPPSRFKRGGISEAPLPESQQRLQRVRISPRDVYRLTWPIAERELASSINLDFIPIILYTDEEYLAKNGSESVWTIAYYGNSDSVTFLVDAQTGEIVEKVKQSP